MARPDEGPDYIRQLGKNEPGFNKLVPAGVRTSIDPGEDLLEMLANNWFAVARAGP